MFKFIFLIAFASAMQLIVAEVTIQNVVDGLELTLTYQETSYTKESSYSYALASSEVQLIFNLEKSKWDEWDTEIKYMNSDLQKMLYASRGYFNIVNNGKDGKYAEMFFNAEHWNYEYPGEFQFKSGQVSGPASSESSSKIIAESTKTDEKCFKNLYEKKQSNEKRSCDVSEDCLKKVTNTKKDGDMSPDRRLQFLNDMAIMNCTERPKDMDKIVPKLCTILYGQVQKISKEPIDLGTASIYLEKLEACGTFGYSEFFADDIVKPIIALINSDGSVGSSSENQVPEIMKLTAQTTAVLASTLRMKIQMAE